MSQSESFYVGLIDVAFLKRQGARKLGTRSDQIEPDAGGVVSWLKSLGSHEVGSGEFLRAYWYDGQFEANHPSRKAQDQFYDAIGFTPGVQLRLGNVSENEPELKKPIMSALVATANGLGIDPAQMTAEFGKHWKWMLKRAQKGVDTRIVLDMVRLARGHTIETAVLLAGDRDLAEAVRTAQDEGCRAVVAAPDLRYVAKELKQLADIVIELDEASLRSMLVAPAPSTSRSRSSPQSSSRKPRRSTTTSTTKPSKT